MPRQLIRQIGIAAITVLILAIVVLEVASIRNGRRLNALKAQFCNLELPPDSERRQCVAVRGTIALSAGPGKHCDYLVWMKMNSDASPSEMVEWFAQRPITGTDGDSMLIAEVFAGHSGIAPIGAKYRYHIQVIDAGHPPGIDPECYLTR